MVDAAIRTAQLQLQQREQAPSQPHNTQQQRQPRTHQHNPTQHHSHHHQQQQRHSHRNADAHGDADTNHLPGGSHPPAVLAIHALAVVSPAQRASLSSQWETAWHLALASDDWRALELGNDQGPAATLVQLLRGTAVYRAARLCCGTDVFGEGPGGGDTAQLLQVQRWLQEWSVEYGPKAVLLVGDALQMALSSGGVGGASAGMIPVGPQPMVS